MSAADFATTAKEAEQKCPVANALRGNVKIDVAPA
jgi:organic hydroperoxide reductase OsmC/OhrA